MEIVEAVIVMDGSAPRILEYARKGYLYIAHSFGYDDTYLLAKSDITVTEDDIEDDSIKEIMLGDDIKVIIVDA